MTDSKQRVIILPGNGCAPIETANWYKWLQNELNKTGEFDAICEEMPDPDEAKKSIWLPFIRDQLKVDDQTIVIGHSSGAEACMRLCETDRVKGLILVSACHTDLGVENERLSGWYEPEWKWHNIKNNAGFIIQYHSADDRFIPISEAEFVNQALGSQFIRQNKRGHYLRKTFPDLLELLINKRKEEKAKSSETEKST